MKFFVNVSKMTALFLILLTFGCETPKQGWQSFGEQPLKNQKLTINVPEKSANNGDLAQLMIRVLDLDGSISDNTDKQLCLSELQRMGHWPQGTYNISEPVTNVTMLKIEFLKNKASQEDGGAKQAKFAQGSEITIKIYDIGNNREEREKIETKVDKNGNITLPFIKQVSVEGLNAAEASTKIRQSYIDKGIYKDLTVDVIGQAGLLYVRGEVKEPGKKEFLGGMKLSDLLIECGGVTEFAETSEIKITRGNKQSIHDYDKINDGEAKDPVLKPGDHIFIPRRII